jgi:hypothetical protein
VDKLTLITQSLQLVDPKQLAVAFECAVFMLVEDYIRSNPIPAATDEAQRAVRREMVAITMANALNTAAEVITSCAKSQEKQDNAADIATAAIAKAAGKLN